MSKCFEIIKSLIKMCNIWKLIFIVYCCVLVYLNFGGLMSVYQITELNLLIGCVLTLCSIFVGGFFYSLGWNKKLYSRKACNVIFTLLMAVSVALCTFSVYLSLPQSMAQLKIAAGEDVSDSTLRLNAILFALIIYVLIYLFLNLPVICSYFRYKRRYDELKLVNKPYWKLFLTYFVAYFFVNTVYLITDTDKSDLNRFDYAAILSYLINAVICIGYAYNLRLGKRLIWQILILPYIVFNFLIPVFSSEHFLFISQTQLITSSIVALVTYSVCFVAFFYVYFRYAFTNDVYQNSDK